jgi:hypothetical protein
MVRDDGLDPETVKFLNSFGGDPMILGIDEAQARFVRDIKVWGEFVKMARIEPQ